MSRMIILPIAFIATYCIGREVTKAFEFIARVFAGVIQ